MAGKWEAPAIGISLGATDAKGAVWRNGEVEFITDEKGNSSFPTYLAFTGDEHHIGESAKQQATLDPANVVSGFTHMVGKSATDILTGIGKLPFALTPGPNNKPTITVQHKGEEKQLTPEETTTMFLQKLRERAEAQLGIPVQYAVIAVPTNFTDEQCNAVKNAAIAAGFLEVELVPDSTAVSTALSFAWSRKKTAPDESSDTSSPYDEETESGLGGFENRQSEEVWAYGAAVQGAILCGQVRGQFGTTFIDSPSYGEIPGEDYDATTKKGDELGMFHHGG